MEVNAKFYCNHCSNVFDKDNADHHFIACPICDGYKISLQVDLWREPDPESYYEEH